MRPTFAKLQGLQHAYSSQGKNNETVVVTIWDAQKNSDNWASSSLWQEIGEQVNGYFVAPHGVEVALR